MAIDGDGNDRFGKEAKTGSRWSPFVLADGTEVSELDQQTFAGFAEQAHSVGVSVNNSAPTDLLAGVTDCETYFGNRGYPGWALQRIGSALRRYQLLAFGLPADSPLNHLSRTDEGDYVDTTFAALDPSWAESGLAASLRRVLTERPPPDS